MRKTFRLTEDHIKLVRKFYVGWQDCEYGAPEIDPKRPYGNSSVELDIHEILTGELLDSDKLTRELEAAYRQLHHETRIALQIILTTGSFVPGVYSADPYRIDWKLEVETILPLDSNHALNIPPLPSR